MAGQSETDNKPEPLFLNLTADEDGISEIESLCMNCHEQGMTRLMLTRIPFFKEVIISSFSCDHCSFSDREIQFGGSFQEKGCRISLIIDSEKDLNRQVVKSDWCMFSIPQIQFEQPPSKKGEINTIEGLLEAVENGIESCQPARRIQDPEVARKLDEFLEKLRNLRALKKPFEIILDDPTGNSFIENPDAPKKDAKITINRYTRTRQQDVDIGIRAEDDDDQEDVADNEKTDNFTGKDEVLSFPANCPNCNAPCETKMKVVDIPHFKETVIMATNCDICGHKENEVKGGSGIEPRGKKYTLRITDIRDLTRDILKSDTCALQIPELDFELMEGTLGGKFTTVEGLLVNIKEQLQDKNPFVCGDSAVDDSKQKLEEFMERFNKILTGETMGVHFVLDDPAGNSYLQNLYAPDDDPELTVETYERSYEQNEALGINDMKTENYENDTEHNS